MSGQSEGVIKAQILAALGSRPDTLVWNHPTGVGHPLHSPTTVIRYGLVGSPDIIGCIACTVQPHHVGQTWGRALGIEVKAATGRVRPEQYRFHAAWTTRAHGLLVVARSVEDVERYLGTVTG